MKFDIKKKNLKQQHKNNEKKTHMNELIRKIT